MLRSSFRRSLFTARPVRAQPPAHFSSQPPSHFGSHPPPPPPVQPHDASYLDTHTPPTNNGNNGNQSSYSNNSAAAAKPLKELTILLTIITLSYLAVDNYINRIKLEKIVTETTILNLKTLKVQQGNFNTAQKRKNLQIINERRDNSKKFTKMGLHVALLRKQLIELGHEPVDIDNVLKEYEKNVKVNTSVNNVTDQILYLTDNSDLKEYYPSVHDYDRTTRSNQFDTEKKDI